MSDNDPGQLHVIFGTAALGSAVMRQLVKKGQRVRMVSRSGRADLPAGVESVRGDASDPASVKAASQGAYAVYYCAAPDYTKWASLYPPMQRAMIEGVGAAGAKLISPESVYMYGPVDGTMTEDSPHTPTARKGRIRAELARMLLDAHAKGTVRAAIGRAPDFYGPEAVVTTIYGDRIFYPALQGKRVDVQGKVDLPHTFIYVDDFAKGLVTLAERDEALGQAWHLPCAPTLTQRELLTMIFEEAGHPLKFREAPALLFKILGIFVPIMKELDEMQYQWQRPYVFGFDKFAKAFGAGDVTPHRDAVRETVAWFRAHPQKK